MDPMLMAIVAAVVIVILAGVFFMKSRNKGDTAATTTTKPSNRPKTLAEQQREIASRPTPATLPAAEPEVNHLAVAQQYFDQKDYPNAVTTLKTGITSQPNRADLQLLLLKSYAQQRNYTEFNQAYQSLSALNDPNATAQASQLKQLLDEEQSQALGTPVLSTPAMNNTASVAPVMAAAAVVPAVAATVPDTLDFDDFSFETEPTAPQPTHSTVSSHNEPTLSDDSFSFDDLESQVLTTDQSTTHAVPSALATPTASVQQNDFDLEFDDFDISAPTTSATTPTASVNTRKDSETLDFSQDLDFPELNTSDLTSNVASPSITPVAPVTPTVNAPDSEFGEFEFDELADATLANTANDTAASHGVSAALVAAPTTAPVEDIEEFDFDFNDSTTATKSAIESAPVTANLDDHNLDNTVVETYSLTAPAEPLHHETTIEKASASDTIADFDDFDLSFDEVANPDELKNSDSSKSVPATDNLTTLSEKSEEDFTFDFEETTSTSSPALPQSSSATLPADSHKESDAFDFDLADEISPVQQPVVQSAAEFDSSLLDAKTPSQAPTFDFDKAVADTDTFSQLDTLYAQETPVNIAPVAPASLASIDPTAVVPQDSTPVHATTSAPVALEGTDFSQAFDFIKHIDTTQLNLDLAEQYIELGEYDSAKRLLNEINNANPAQQQVVTHLLEKIG